MSSEIDYDQLRMKARLDSLKLRRQQLGSQQSVTKKVAIVLFIIAFPILFYFYDRWAAVRKCNMFDNNLVNRYEAAKPKHIEVTGTQIAMALRGNLRGIYRLFFFGAGDNSVKFPQMLQFYNNSSIAVADGSGVRMRDVMQDEQRAAVVIQTLYNTNQTAGTTEPVLDMVCNSGLDSTYVPAECYEDEEEEEKDCGANLGASALDGVAQSIGCIFSGNPPMIAGCMALTMGVNLFGGATAGGCF